MPKALKLPGHPDLIKLDSHTGTICIAWWTLLLHLIWAFYFIEIYIGGSSISMISPLFEYSKDTMQSYSIKLAIYCIIFMIFGSLGLIKGVNSETRIYYFPWLIFTLTEIIVMFHRGFSLIWKYSYDSETIMTATILLLFALYHTYLYLVVLSNYRYLKRIQNPTLVFPPEI